MSRPNSSTLILDAALRLITRQQGADVTLADIAKAAGVSRQAVYLHFTDRADLLVALVRHVHEKLGAAREMYKVEDAPTGVAAMREWVALQVRLNPPIWPVARALEVARRTDEAAEQAWQDRQMHRLETCRRLVGRMAQEGTLKPGICPGAAADVLWSITSVRAWEDFVLGLGWTAAQYEERITRLLCDALTDDAMSRVARIH